MVMYLRFAVNSHVHNQRHRITPLEPPQTLGFNRYFSKGLAIIRYVAGQCTTLVITLDWSNPCLK